MEKKKMVAISDDAMEMVSGGLIMAPDRVKNEITGEIFPLKVNIMVAYGALVELGGDADDNQRIAKLQELGYI